MTPTLRIPADRRLALLLASILTLSASFTSSGCSYFGPKPQPPAQKIEPLEAAQKVETEKAVLVDVRALELARKGTPTVALQVEPKDLATRFKEISTSRPVIILCESAACAEEAANRLTRVGYRGWYLESYEAWEKAGLALRKNW